jgi:hypothetical protein
MQSPSTCTEQGLLEAALERKGPPEVDGITVSELNPAGGALEEIKAGSVS